VGGVDTSPLLFQGTQQAAEIAAVETEPRAQVADLRAVAADFENEAGLRKGPVAAEVMIVKRADGLTDPAIKTADTCDPMIGHYLTKVSYAPVASSQS